MTGMLLRDLALAGQPYMHIWAALWQAHLHLIHCSIAGVAQVLQSTTHGTEAKAIARKSMSVSHLGKSWGAMHDLKQLQLIVHTQLAPSSPCHHSVSSRLRQICLVYTLRYMSTQKFETRQKALEDLLCQTTRAL